MCTPPFEGERVAQEGCDQVAEALIITWFECDEEGRGKGVVKGEEGGGQVEGVGGEGGWGGAGEEGEGGKKSEEEQEEPVGEGDGRVQVGGGREVER